MPHRAVSGTLYGTNATEVSIHSPSILVTIALEPLAPVVGSEVDVTISIPL